MYFGLFTVFVFTAGITTFQFELPYNSSVLNSWMNIPLFLAGVDGVTGLNDGISIEEIGNARPPPVAVTPGRVVESVDVSVATSPSKDLPNEEDLVIKKLPPDPKTDDKPSTSSTVKGK